MKALAAGRLEIVIVWSNDDDDDVDVEPTPPAPSPPTPPLKEIYYDFWDIFWYPNVLRRLVVFLVSDIHYSAVVSVFYGDV